jgi:AAA+ ATPase superfamily predicted ATPase
MLTVQNFDYILEKINNSKIIDYPFPHLDIRNFLSKEHLQLIINEKQIHFDEKKTHDEIYKELLDNGWKIQQFPGCTTNWNDYKKYIEDDKPFLSITPVKNIGITFRLYEYKNNIIKNLINFMNSIEFHNTLKRKFNIKEDTNIISAIQKNLSGYEISPHPDVRQKCLTYLLNINNNKEIESLDCNTHLLEFKDKYKHVQKYWEKNQHITRCWVPWEWCNTIKKTNENNSMIIFHPDNNPPTLHAIRLKYNHLKYQRTQIYGNLMYKDPLETEKSNYTDFII